MKTLVKYLYVICLFLAASLTVNAQSITDVNPAFAPQGQTISVAITGQDTTFFQSSPTITDVWLSQGSLIVDANSFTATNANSMTAVFDIPADATQGIWDLHVVNTVDGQLTLADGFTIYVYPDLNGDGKVDLEDFALYTKHYLEEQAPAGMIFITIENDPGVGSGHEGFDGQISKYETTNAQYCSFLNAALESGDIYVSSNKVYGTNGSNSGTDFPGKVYLETYAADSDSQITYSNGKFTVRHRDGHNMNDYPVVEVSWYGATAFCNYYGWYLPTQWQWQAVADYDGTYTYGCGTSIDQSTANYYLSSGNFSNPIGLSSFPYTTPSNYYSTFGYGVGNMAGNVSEWTSTADGTKKVLKGGSWVTYSSKCTVSSEISINPESMSYNYGFRPCR